MKQRTRWIAGLAAAALVLATAATAFAYEGQVDASITVGPRGSVTCDAPVTLVATLLDGEGQPMADESVAWSFVQSPSSSDQIDRTPTVTNAEGIATTTITLAPVSGTREIRATSGDVRASAIISPACGGLPSTSTAPASSPDGAPPAGLVLLVVLGVAGAGVALRRLPTTGR